MAEVFAATRPSPGQNGSGIEASLNCLRSGGVDEGAASYAAGASVCEASLPYYNPLVNASLFKSAVRRGIFRRLH